jgi:hypothetical protein
MKNIVETDKQVAGMSEDEILSLCDEKNILCSSVSGYWTSEIYGFGKYIREYGYYPKWMPLKIFTDHGPAQNDFPIAHELESDSPTQFYHSPRIVAEWKKVSKKPCYSLYSPFVYYRQTRKVIQDSDAKGTLVYPAHTTPLIDDESDYEEYIEQLMSLPEEFHPISVQLHIHDINKGQHKLFMRHKIPIYTAGHYADYRFPERFYDILRRHRYTTSNIVMSCLFYSIEMGIPHFLYGMKPEFNNKGQDGIEKGKNFKPLEQWKQMQKITSLFSGVQTEITKTQKEIVEYELGMTDGIGRLEMMRVLYSSLLKSGMRKILKKTK